MSDRAREKYRQQDCGAEALEESHSGQYITP